MKASLFLALAALVSSSQAFAGAANADLKCTGQGISIEGSVPGDLGEWDFKVSKGGRESRIYSVTNQGSGETEENGKVAVVDRMHDAVWTLTADRIGRDWGFVQMYAMPKTVKYKSTRNGYRASFQAKVSFNLGDIARESVDAAVACTIVHEI
jgi:hypothetical protein